MEDKILTKGQFEYCVNDIASDVINEKMKILDYKIRGWRFLFKQKAWREWEGLLDRFSSLVSQSTGMRLCLSDKELKECYKIRKELRLLESAERNPKIMDEDWYWVNTQ